MACACGETVIAAKGLCRRCYRRQWNLDNTEKMKHTQSEWHIANKERRNKERMERYYANRETELQKQRETYRKTHPLQEKKSKQTKDEYNAGRRAYQEVNRELCRQRNRDHYQRNKKHYLYKWTMRNAAKLQRTPKWLSEQDKLKIKQLIENTPEGYDLDHIVPLQGKNVSGLNVPWNMQYLPSKENRSKGNRHESD
jgi:hypothetical protein